jgi:parallel beta helix pectate lyase-like protein
MSIKVRSSLHSLVIIAVLIFSAAGTTIAYADGGTSKDTPPTETTTSECASDGTSSKCPSDVVATEVPVEATSEAAEPTTAEAEATSVPTEVAVEATPDASSDGSGATEETAAPMATEASTALTEAAPSEDTTILNDVPEGTTIEVVNADGQSEPLATQAAADAIATTSDPIWCPVVNGVATAPGGTGCTQSFPSFNALLTFLSGNAGYQGAGTIYVEQGAYQGGESSIDFNNYNLSNISSADLTITGGWNIPNHTIDPTTTSNFTVPIVIGTSTNPWGGALTINNINISNTNGTGLTVYAQDVNIDNSKFERNRTAGAILRATRNVTISNSSFSNPANARRQLTGLDIESGGSVSLQNVLADQNRDVGAKIVAGGSVSIGVTVGSPIGTSSFSGTKNIVGSNFLGYGLQVKTPGAIAIDGVAANDNFLWGASLIGGNVTISNSTFNANTTASPGFIDDTGLLVTSSGTVNIDHIEANDNRLIGATITATGTGSVSINDSTFTNNNGVTLDSAGNQTFHGYGLNVVTDSGNISLNRVDASNNTLFGAHLESKGLADASGNVIFGDITISSNPSDPSNPIPPLVTVSTFSNNTTSNNPTGPATSPLGRGLEVITGGAVLLDNVLINNNETFGAHIQAGGDVFLDTVTATSNGQNGVEVTTSCKTVYLISGIYTNNGGYGLSILNSALNQSGLPLPVVTPNGVGNIFQDPGTCVFPVSVGQTPTTPSTPTTPVTSQQSGNVLTGTINSTLSGGNTLNTSMSFKSSSSISSNLDRVTLNSFLANTRLANDVHVSVFMGKYAYIYSSSGMQIVAYAPSSLNHVAMVGPH